MAPTTATPTRPPAGRSPSKVEGIKERSNFLREPVASELKNDHSYFSEDAIQLMKFHGSYQQDNRENRIKGQEKDYQMMLRTRSPGGFVPPELYLALDKLSDQYGNGTIRATTRQGFQLHGILKKHLKASIAAIVGAMGSTLGACGDLNRNVMAPPAPFKNRADYAIASDYANRIADLLTPETGAYYEIWLDGEKAVSAQEHPDVVAARRGDSQFADSEEPIYGTYYLPRKFKAAVTVPGDNSVDLFSQDLSLVTILQGDQLQGFNIYAGGGLGRTHGKDETFPRIADPIGYVEAADIYAAVKAIVATQRDYGDRTDRRHARMKYLIEDWGVEKFKNQVETTFGKPFAPLQPLPEWKYEDFLGWHDQGDGKLFVGVSVENGRVKDAGPLRLKTLLKKLVTTYKLPMVLTPSQNIVLYDILPKDKAAIVQLLEDHGILGETTIDPLVRYSMACPALPLCGLATTEAERALPDILARIRAVLAQVGLPEEHFIVRMTGCPNGCARPYLAEMGFVGNSPGQYQLWLGAAPNQTRLSQVYLEKLPIDQLESTLEPIFILFKKDRLPQESFGNFCNRIGFAAIRAFATGYTSSSAQPNNSAGHPSVLSNLVIPNSAMSDTAMSTPATPAPAAPAAKSSNPIRHRVTVQESTYEKLKTAAASQGKTVVEIASAAIDKYLETLA
jgi:sulfite reductase (ferredoxin)